MSRQPKTARQLLNAKPAAVAGVIRVAPGDTVLSALELMRAKNIGAVIVLDGGAFSGILTERDYARKVELEGQAARACLVHQIMTAHAIVYAAPSDSVDRCRALMMQHHVRHLPVLENGDIQGVLSVRDVLEAIIAEDRRAIRELETDRLLMTTNTGTY